MTHLLSAEGPMGKTKKFWNPCLINKSCGPPKFNLPNHLKALRCHSSRSTARTAAMPRATQLAQWDKEGNEHSTNSGPQEKAPALAVFPVSDIQKARLCKTVAPLWLAHSWEEGQLTRACFPGGSKAMIKYSSTTLDVKAENTDLPLKGWTTRGHRDKINKMYENTRKTIDNDVYTGILPGVNVRP